MKKLVLHRLEKLADRTLGRLFVFNGTDLIAGFTTLELPFRNNARQISSIPSAFYMVEPRHAEKFGDHLIIKDVPSRDYILFHAGNFPKDTHGCILVGSGFGDADKDGLRDITASRKAMAELVKIVTEPAELTVL